MVFAFRQGYKLIVRLNFNLGSTIPYPELSKVLFPFGKTEEMIYIIELQMNLIYHIIRINALNSYVLLGKIVKLDS